MGKYVSEETKQTVLEDIKNGMKVSEAVTKYGVADKSIYRWMRDQADNSLTFRGILIKSVGTEKLMSWIGILSLSAQAKKRVEKLVIPAKAGIQ